MIKPLPTLTTDADAEAFVETADLSEFDLSAMTPTRFEFAAKAARVNMRLPSALLEAVKAKARSQGVPYQRFIRQALVQAVSGPMG
jgi:predicted DNA binding CopG/RHH family protein